MQMAKIHLLCVFAGSFCLVGTSTVSADEQAISTRDLFHGSSCQLKRWGLGWEDAEAHALHWIPASLGGSTLLTQLWLPSFLPVLVTSLIALTRYSMKSSMEVKGFILSPSLKVQAIVVERRCVRSVRLLDTSLTVWKQRQMDAGAGSTFLLFFSLGSQFMELCLLRSGCIFPLQLIFFCKHPHRHTQRCGFHGESMPSQGDNED